MLGFYCAVAWLVNLEEKEDCLEAMPHRECVGRIGAVCWGKLAGLFRSIQYSRKSSSYDSL